MVLVGGMRLQMRRACQKDGESRKRNNQLACGDASARHREPSMPVDRKQSRCLEGYKGESWENDRPWKLEMLFSIAMLACLFA